MIYNPGLHVATNKPLGLSDKPIDARSMFYDSDTFEYRLFKSLDEVLSYFNTPSSRKGSFSIYVELDGDMEEYIFRPPYNNSDLVRRFKAGPKGDVGPKGDKGETGSIGPKGDAFTHSDFTEEQLESLVGPVGPQGEQGLKGDRGESGPKGDAFTYSHFTSEQLESLVGPKGDQGAQGEIGGIGPKGEDGYTPVKGVDYFDGEKGDTGEAGYTPTKYVDYRDGIDGQDGKDGYTPIKGIDYFDGIDGEAGYTPVKGVDYFDGKDGSSDWDNIQNKPETIKNIEHELSLKVNQVDGEGLTPEKFTLDYKNKLEDLENYDDTSVLNLIADKVDREENKGLSERNFTQILLDKINSVTAIFTSELKTTYDNVATWVSDNKNSLLDHLANKNNPHEVDKSQVGLPDVDNTSDLDKPISTLTGEALGLKVDKELGKNLIDDTDIVKLSGIEAGATKNKTDAYLLDYKNFTNTPDPLPAGGTTNQLLKKASNADGDAKWEGVTGGDLGLILGSRIPFWTGTGWSAEGYSISQNSVVNGSLIQKTATGQAKFNAGLVDLDGVNLGQLNTLLSEYAKLIALSDYVLISKRDLPLGWAGVNEDGKIGLHLLPDSILSNMRFGGTYDGLVINSSSNFTELENEPLPSPDDYEGVFFIATGDFTEAPFNYKEGDWIVSLGTSWTRVANADAVTTVFGRPGNVLAIEADYAAFYPKLSAIYDNPSWINSLSFSKITDVPELTKAEVEAKLTGEIDSHTHPASNITESTAKRFVSDTEKAAWNGKSELTLGETAATAYRGDGGKIAYDHSQSAHAPANAQKNSDITKAEIESKLIGEISTHSHSAAQIAESATKRFVTDAEKSAWNAKANIGTTAGTVRNNADLDARYAQIMTHKFTYNSLVTGNDSNNLLYTWNDSSIKMTDTAFVTDSMKAISSSNVLRFYVKVLTGKVELWSENQPFSTIPSGTTSIVLIKG